ncbi:hypothetical protein [Thauera linaloolentis]|uniref:hypothetical protein n=1 Tax=Thauera linaloolentis TaxID=76112 RepID=UPI00030D8C62|nr:hypothetical protein [Thauera linaloolentis]MCM8566181.1 hypothetical protein [Thauera linaloolentis]
MMIPTWAAELRRLFWFLRAARHLSRPTPRTWRRRITAEKRRLLAAGVDLWELHAVCVMLRRNEHSTAAKRAREFLENRQKQAADAGDEAGK